MRFILSALFIFLFLSGDGPPSIKAASPGQPISAGQTIVIDTGPLVLVDRELKRQIPAAEAFLNRGPANTAAANNFSITYTGSWTTEMKAAFDFACSVWSSIIDPNVVILVNAQFGAYPGFASTSTRLGYNYPGLPRTNTLYPMALVNHYAGYDVDPSNYDFTTSFNSSYNWYFGTGGATPFSQYDFATVAMHEIGHGLGMIPSFQSNSWGFGYSIPSVYDLFVENGSGQSLLNTSLFPNPSAALAAQLTGGDIYFDGPKTRAVNGSQRARLFAPSSFLPGSSISHLDEIYNGTANSLMTYSITNGEWVHNPGVIAAGIMGDLGWPVLADTPIIYALPDQLVQMNTQRLKAVDLWAYSPASQSPGTNFTYIIANTPSAGAGVSLSANRYFNIVPTPGWLGSTQVTVRATNLQGLSATASFDVHVVTKINPIYLPAISR